MSKLVVINLAKGDLNHGFSSVTAQLWETNNSRPTQFVGSLPPAPEIAELYKRFQIIYQALYQRLKRRSELEIEECGLTNVSEVEFTDVCQQLNEEINAWLNSNSFRQIDQQLRARLTLNEEFQVIIETDDNLLRRLPWHLWSFFADYQKAEVALSNPKYERNQTSIKNSTEQVRILAVLGNSEGIDIQQDRYLLEQLPDASIVFLVEPPRQELDKWLWDEKGWDILFFAGHSQSRGDTGLIHINQTNSLTISELKNALKYAITRGLKLAIFNSCDGLGLAKELADLHLGQIIVMREDVPDLVAQEFLKNFLTAFARGESLYLAMRYAREKLQGLEDGFFAASWLPIICINPAEETPTWNKLRGKTKKITQHKFNWANLRTIFLASIIATTSLFAVRSLGIMQQWELSAFDSMMRIRPNENSDKRILIVTITEADIQAQKQKRKSSLSDEALQQLLQKLALSKPRAIGLDIYRDFPVEAAYPELANRLRQSNNLIPICQVSSGKTLGIASPPEIPIERVGFSDVIPDNDLVIRRQLLALTPSPQSPCKTSYSLSLQLARQYLAQENIQLSFTKEGYLQLGNVIFKPLNVPTSGYQKFDPGGHQIILNYRSSREIAQKVTLTQILNNQFNPDWVKDKIILIGADAESIKDSFLTPYSSATVPHQEISGVEIHAHMVSEIISAVLDKRSLLWTLPAWGEFLWILGWCLIGCIITLYHSSRLQLALLLSGVLLTLYASTLILLIYGGWMPVLPSILALLTAASGAIFYVK